MPDKYMREIEEILRNIERTEPRNDPGERIRPFARPPRRRSFSLPQLELPVTLILLGIALALVGSGLAYYQMSPTLASGLIAVAGFALFVAGLALTWWARFHGVSMSASTRSLRRPPPTDNVVRMRPARSNPLSRLMTNIRMRRMRRRYRNFSDH